MIEKIKIRLGESANNFSDGEIVLAYEDSKNEVLEYTNRDTLTAGLEVITELITVIKLNRKGTEGLSSEGYSGSSYSYINGYPEEIRKALDKNRVVKTYG